MITIIQEKFRPGKKFYPWLLSQFSFLHDSIPFICVTEEFILAIKYFLRYSYLTVQYSQLNPSSYFLNVDTLFHLSVQFTRVSKHLADMKGSLKKNSNNMSWMAKHVREEHEGSYTEREPVLDWIVTVDGSHKKPLNRQVK